ncbi:MAG: hypothetical protein Kow0047_30220 [Anaerolineae bacterium]
MMMGFGMFGYLLMLLFWVLIIVVAVVVVAALFPRVTSGSSASQRQMGPPERPAQETPLDILKRRYASGEITREEYEQIRRDLMD